MTEERESTRMETETKPKRKGGFRAFVSSLALFSFLVLATTGVILYFSPRGRVANWTGWTFWGLTRDDWQGAHMIFALAFTICSVLHIWLNWRPLLTYFKSRTSGRFTLRPAWFLAGILCVGLFTGMVMQVNPFQYLLIWNTQIKDYWEDPARRTPPHAEIMPLRELLTQQNIDPDEAVSRLEAKGVSVPSLDIVVEDLAEENNISPEQVYLIASGQEPTRGGRGQGERRGQGGQGGGRGQEGYSESSGEHSPIPGLGRMTLGEYCTEVGVDVETTLQRLEKRDIYAAKEDTIREIATMNDTTPSEIRRIAEEQ